MFELYRQIFRRQPIPAHRSSGLFAAEPMRTGVAVTSRHPAMRGLNVSPVHGHHCICSRCAPTPRIPDHDGRLRPAA